MLLLKRIKMHAFPREHRAGNAKLIITARRNNRIRFVRNEMALWIRRSNRIMGFCAEHKTRS